MERIWHHTLHDKLSTDPEEHNVFLTDCVFSPKADREKTAEIMFETFRVPSMYIGMQ